MISATPQTRPAVARPRARLWPAMALIVVPFLLLIAMQGYEALSRSPRAVHRQHLVTHSFQVILTLQALRGAVQDAERGQRGFLLTGRAIYLAPYENARQDVPQLLTRLGQLTAIDPETHAALRTLAQTIDRKLTELQSTISAYRRDGPALATTIVRTNAGLDAMRSIESQIDAMTNHERALLTHRLTLAAAADRAVQRFAIASTLLAAALMIIGVTLTVMNWRRSRRLHAELIHRADDSIRTNQELERRNVELAHASEMAREAREEALHAERAKGRFLATASHDLRQPLQAVSLLNGAMRRKVTDPDLTDALGQQADAVGTMGRLLNALLDISKLEAGVVKPEPRDFAVAELLETMAREFRGVAISKGLQLQIEATGVFAHSDPALVEQILRNLTSNAIKYTPAGTVRLRATADSDWVNIEVIDSGVGIPADQIRHIGEEFYQIGVPSNSTRDGYGLGMSIVRRLVKLLRIELDVRSQVGHGSTFTIRLAHGARTTLSARPTSATLQVDKPRAGMGRHILLVEDDPDVCKATRMLLRAEGYGVVTASCADEAVQKAHECDRLDLLVTDFHLGADSTGTQVITMLREKRGTSLKAILITGDTSSAIKGIAQDPHLRILSKPVQAEEFLRLVHELLTV